MYISLCYLVNIKDYIKNENFFITVKYLTILGRN